MHDAYASSRPDDRVRPTEALHIFRETFSYSALPADRPKPAAALSFVVVQHWIDGADIHWPAG
jgi:hypothetical protein